MHVHHAIPLIGRPGRLLGAMTLGLALTLTACGNDKPTDNASSQNQQADHNDADVTFAQGMVPHHQQAVLMSDLAQDRATSEEVKKLAADIKAAQAPEIEQLSAWLTAWGEEEASGGMDHGDTGDMGDMGDGDMDHGSGSDGAGMMSAEDMSMLRSSDGAEFDRMFLTMMVEHHKGAVSQAETEVAKGENPDAIAMAKDIIATQNDEIDQMEQLLKQL